MTESQYPSLKNKGLFLNDAQEFQQALSRTQELYRLWGYTIVHTPMVDYFSSYKQLFSQKEEEQLYRLIGRDGNVLVLRSDITIFLLRHYHSILQTTTLPIRLGYCDSIARYEESHEISRKEDYQTGVEYISNFSKKEEAEQEILLLLAENLRTLGIKELAIHIGSHKIVDTLFQNYPASAYKKVVHCIIHRNWNDLKQILRNNKNSDLNCDQIINLFSLLTEFRAGGMAKFKEALFLPQSVAKEIWEEVEYIFSLAQFLKQHFPDQILRIDFSEIGNRHYYSGITFQVYHPQIPFALASGGCYDSLLKEMNIPASACGYSIMISAALARGKPAEFTPKSVENLSSKFPNSSVDDRFARAKKLRAKGISACL